VNVEAQQANPNSLLWWMQRLIALRKRYQAFGRGTIQFLYPDNRKVLAFLRRYKDEDILIVVNLSRLAQFVDLDLSAFTGSVPVELFGGTEFPPLSNKPFFLTLGPHAYYWFVLEPAKARQPFRVAGPELQKIAAKSLDDLLHGGPRERSSARSLRTWPVSAGSAARRARSARRALSR
jgi:hypothetical protein